MTANSAGTGLAIFGLYAACVSITAALGAAGCAAAATAAVAATIGLVDAVRSGQTTSDIELGPDPDEDYWHIGSRALISVEDQHDDGSTHPLYGLLAGVLGSDYKFEGYADPAHERHAHLTTLNGGKPVRVHSFTSGAGTRFHHPMVFDKGRNGLFHRFGFAPAENDTATSKRQIVAPTNEYFTSGGLDLFDCAGGDGSPDHLNLGDAGAMEAQIQCNSPFFALAGLLEIQVYDMVSSVSCDDVL